MEFEALEEGDLPGLRAARAGGAKGRKFQACVIYWERIRGWRENGEDGAGDKSPLEESGDWPEREGDTARHQRVENWGDCLNRMKVGEERRECARRGGRSSAGQNGGVWRGEDLTPDAAGTEGW